MSTGCCSFGDDGRKHETLCHKLFVIDNDGRENEMEIVKKVLKTTPEQVNAAQL
jgi:3,4-dihydroxy-2-butanone 4-phosphate synthase